MTVPLLLGRWRGHGPPCTVLLSRGAAGEGGRLGFDDFTDAPRRANGEATW